MLKWKIPKRFSFIAAFTKIVALFIQLCYRSYVTVFVHYTYSNCQFISSSTNLPPRMRNREVVNISTIASSKKLLIVINTDSLRNRSCSKYRWYSKEYHFKEKILKETFNTKEVTVNARNTLYNRRIGVANTQKYRCL